MTHLLIVCKDCRHEVWMTPREYIKWRCPLCNGYPAVRESRRNVVAEDVEHQRTGFVASGGSLDDDVAAAMREEICSASG